MNESQENSILVIRLVCISISSALIAIPQILWSEFGYQGPFLIVIESSFIFIGFLFLLCGLITHFPGPVLNFTQKIWARVETWASAGKLPVKLATFGLLTYALYLIVPVFLSGVEHYSSVPSNYEALLAIFTLASLAILVFLHKLETKMSKNLTRLFYVPIAVLALTWAFAFWAGSPKYPTDEMLLDYYSAHLALQGTNPYVVTNTAGVFGFIHSSIPGFPLSIGTPLLTGGLVTSFSYPALSIYSYIPAQVLGISPSATLLPLYAVPPLIIFSLYSDIKFRLLSLSPVFILLLNPSYLIQTGLGYPDILWAILMLISISTYKKPVISGLSMGLALAVKQIPWIAFPFFLIFIFRETGRKAGIAWTTVAAAAFFLPNLPFIFNDPSSFFQALASPGLLPLIGIGFGPSQLGFLGILPLSREFFTAMVACLGISFMIIYISYYEKLRFAFLAFPLIIFLFNYRFLLDYVIFWPIIALAIPALMRTERDEAINRQHKKISFRGKEKVIALTIAVLLLGVPLGIQALHPVTGDISIENISIASTGNGNVTAISLSLWVENGNLSYGQVLYRIVPLSSMPNLNGYLWQHGNITTGNNGAMITILPENSLQQIPASGKYRIIAYYGDISAILPFTITNGTLT